LRELHDCGCCFAMLAGCKRDAQRLRVELWRGIWPNVAQWLWEGCQRWDDIVINWLNTNICLLKCKYLCYNLFTYKRVTFSVVFNIT
jgi:hypothetical protein